jgi:hypothetical protein
MTSPYGVQLTGFVIKPREVIRAELEAAWRTAYGANLDVDAESSDAGREIDIYADRLTELWEVLQAVYGSFDPDGAEGNALVQLAAITGTLPQGATASTADLVAWGTAGTLLATGRAATGAGVGTNFETTAPGTIVTAPSWATATNYAAGSLVKNGGNLYYAITGGVSGGGGGPTGTGTAIADGAAVWRYIAAATAGVVVPSAAVVLGSVTANAGMLTIIQTPVSGWLGVVNPLDAVRGLDADDDVALRERREAELGAEGNAALEPIRAAVLKPVEQGGGGASSCSVFENPTDATDGDGIPPHAIEVVVAGGADQDVADAIFASKGAGIATYGTSSRNVTDSAGTVHVVKFTRPTIKPVYVILNVGKDPSLYPAGGDVNVRDAVVAKGDALKMGQDVFSFPLGAAALGVPGVTNVDSVLIGLTNPPVSSAAITIGPREQADFDTGRTTVNSSNEVP